MNFLHGRKVQKLIRDLNYNSPEVATIEAAIDQFRQQNPFLGLVGRYRSVYVGGTGGAELNAALRPLRDLQKRLSEAEEKEKSVRAQAALELGKLRDLSAVEPLIVALKDRHPLVRSNAAMALGNIGDSRAIAALTSLVQGDSDESVRGTAQQALEVIKKGIPG